MEHALREADTDPIARSSRPVTRAASNRHSRPTTHVESQRISLFTGGAPAQSTSSLDDDVEKGPRLESITSSRSVSETSEEIDPDIVWWDSEDDPQNPQNWPFSKKWGTVAILSAITFLTPLASSMFAPGVPQVMEEFNSTSQLLESFVLSVYVLGFAFGPLGKLYRKRRWTHANTPSVIAPLSEMYGRLPLYHICNCLFVILGIAVASSTNIGMFIAFRFFMGCKCLILSQGEKGVDIC